MGSILSSVQSRNNGGKFNSRRNFPILSYFHMPNKYDIEKTPYVMYNPKRFTMLQKSERSSEVYK